MKFTTTARPTPTPTYGEWPDYVEDLVSGEIWLVDPFCPGPEEMWIRQDKPYTSVITGMVWWCYRKADRGD